MDAETKTTDGDDNDQRHDEREPTELVSPHEQPDIQRKHPAEDEQVRSHETQTDGRDARDRKRAEQHADGERSGCRGEHDTKQCRVSRGHGDGPRIVEQPRRANDDGPIRTDVRDRAQAVGRIQHPGRELLRHEARGIVGLEDADDGVAAVAQQHQDEQPSCVLGIANGTRQPEGRPEHRDVQEYLRNGGHGRVGERVAQHQRQQDHDGGEPPPGGVQTLAQSARKHPVREQCETDREGRDPKRQANRLRAGQEQQGGERRLQHDEPFRG